MQRERGLRGLVFVGVVGAALAARSGCASGDGRAATGTKGGACYPNGTCNEGLSCATDLCVVLGGAGDDGKNPSDGDGESPSVDEPSPPPAPTCKQGERATDFASCTAD